MKAVTHYFSWQTWFLNARNLEPAFVRFIFFKSTTYVEWSVLHGYACQRSNSNSAVLFPKLSLSTERCEVSRNDPLKYQLHVFLMRGITYGGLLCAPAFIVLFSLAVMSCKWCRPPVQHPSPSYIWCLLVNEFTTAGALMNILMVFG